MKKRILPILFLLLLGGGGYWGYNRFREQVDSDTLNVSGNIEVTDAQISFRIAGRMTERLVDEGQSVRAGQVVARLDRTDQELVVSQAEANVAFAKASLAELEAGSRPEEIARAQAQVEQARFSLAELENGSRVQEVADARAELERAEYAAKTAQAQLDQARSDEARFAAMVKSGVVSHREYEVYHTGAQTARSTWEAALASAKRAREQLSLREEGPRQEAIRQARAALEQAQQQFDLVKAGPRKETIEQARAKLEVAGKTLSQARQQLEYTQLTVPFDSVVLSKSAEPGEYLNPGSPVVTVGDLEHVWLRAYVSETDLGKIRLGDPAEVTTDSYPGKTYHGKISFISSQAEFTPKSVQTFEERVKLMFRIKIDLENPNGELKPGMPADGHLKLNR
ncbi:MAG TPA: efflux RND transporter periplasmic adaptor subunit [Candidatus Sumerlaeota bacterium]|nr:efflux RND transporter periplasmic adaptor subunit [Candidatus Sumerlaeota bacterium]